MLPMSLSCGGLEVRKVSILNKELCAPDGRVNGKINFAEGRSGICLFELIRRWVLTGYLITLAREMSWLEVCRWEVRRVKFRINGRL